MEATTDRTEASCFASSIAEQQWKQALQMLEKNTNLMTQHIFGLALQHRPALQIVRQMLQLNPKLAQLPPQGPSALQIAVQSGCATPVVRALIEAWPFALVSTNPGSHLDPLTYAKRFRGSEMDLIELLSQPLSYWLLEARPSRSKPPPPPRKEVVAKAATTPPSSVSQQRQPQHTTGSMAQQQYATPPNHKAVPKQPAYSDPLQGRRITNPPPPPTTLSPTDRQELDNVKLLCAHILKHQKTLVSSRVKLEDELHVLVEELVRAQSIVQQKTTQAALQKLQKQVTQVVQYEDRLQALEAKVQQPPVQHAVYEPRMVITPRSFETSSMISDLRSPSIISDLRSLDRRSSLASYQSRASERTRKVRNETPIVFATPWKEDDDALSLLSDDESRKETYKEHHVTPVRMCKPWSLLLQE